MKSLMGIILFVGMSAQAQCLRFQQGQEPQQVGNVRLAGPASEVCFQKTGADQAAVSFWDNQGQLAQFTGQIKDQGRCLSLCQAIELEDGQAIGSDMSPRGIVIEIATSKDPLLNILTGVLTIKAGRDFPVKAIVIGKQ